MFQSRRFTGILIFCLLSNFSSAQPTRADSLKNFLAVKKISALYDSAFGYEYTIADSAFAYYKAGLKLAAEVKNDTMIAKAYNGIGHTYSLTGKYSEAIAYLFKALKIFESNQSNERLIGCLQYIAIAYSEQGILDKAMDYSQRALKIAQSINDPYRTAVSMITIGSIYYSEQKHDTVLALTYFQQALHKMEEANDKQGIADALGNVALIYEKQNKFDKALEYHIRALNMANELNDKRGIAASYHNIAEVYKGMKKYPLAVKYYDSCIVCSKQINEKRYIQESYKSLSELYDSMGRYDKAYQTHLLFSRYNDTLLNEETHKQFAEMSTKYESEKKDNEIILLKKDDEINSQKLQRQKIIRNGFMGGFAVVLLFAGVFFIQRNRISREKKRSDELLLNILPEETSEELKATGTAKAKSFDSVTVLFCDFINFTLAAEKLTPEALVKEINHCYSEFDKIVTKYGIEKIKTIGDAYMCAGGLPVANHSHPEDVVKAGLEFQQFIAKNKKQRIEEGQPFFELRCGIHTGPVVAGIVGIKKFAYDIWGDTVNIASRMETAGVAGKVNISGATFELVKDKFECTHRGKILAKNKGEIDMYFVERSFSEV